MLILYISITMYFVVGILVAFFYLRWTVKKHLNGCYRPNFTNLIVLSIIFPIVIIVFLYEYTLHGSFPQYITRLINKDE